MYIIHPKNPLSFVPVVEIKCKNPCYCSPWRAMRMLGEQFGYTFTVTPLGGRIEGPTGERRTEIWTMVSARKLTKSNQV